ncbi:FISUMP domain-containing protein [candidate division KSB1 bacterium]
MKRITILLLLIFAIAGISAQNYQIRFVGKGASTIVDSVIVENLTQCTDTFLSGSDTLHLTSMIGIAGLKTTTGNDMQIYPNPMTGSCTIDFKATAKGKTTIELYDIKGTRILQLQEFLCKGPHTYSLSGIGSGIYMLKVESDKYAYTAKIVSNHLSKGIAEIRNTETIHGTGHQNKDLYKGKIKKGESSKSIIHMQYNTGDSLKITGKSGNYRTFVMLVPTQSQTDTFHFISCTDITGNHYAVVQIGSQIWMAENLKTTKYRNGDFIPCITDHTQWTNLSTGAYCDYENTSGNSTTYGKLYNWYTVNDIRNVCPTGWHVSTNNEWIILSDYFGGDSLAGGKLKENCSTHWKLSNTGATNETGFTALPGGYRNFLYGTFYSIGYYGYWWCDAEDSAGNAWNRGLYYYDGIVYKGFTNQKYGFSVRCVKDY